VSAIDPAPSLQQLHERARRLLMRAQEYLDELAGDELPGQGVEPVKRALTKLDQLLAEGSQTVRAEIQAAGAPLPESSDGARVHAILEITRALSHVMEVDPLLELIMDLVIEHSKAERGFVVLFDAGDEWQIRAARNIDHTTIPEAEREISRSIIERIRRDGEALVVPNALEHSQFGMQESVLALHILSVLAAPISAQGKPQGVVYLESRSVESLFNADDLAFLKVFSAQAGIALQNARAYEEARRAERRLQDENLRLRAELARRHGFQGIIGRSPRMRDVYALIERIAPTPVSVLIRGENGTGKERVARVIHYNSPRGRGPFVSVNCAAIPETLIESELFGIEKGTATGVGERPGKFEVAHGGTLFLDEVGDMSLVTQAKLLRVLQEREIERVGGRKPVPVDVRIIAATNTDLDAAIREKRFREDLYYRLNVVTVTLPPLRERVEDIPLLAIHFLEELGKEFELPGRRLSPEALDRLAAYSWPGNVRELENVISRALVLCDSDDIGVEVLPVEVQRSGGGAVAPLALRGATLENLERAALVQALERNGWVQTRAAVDLGLSERNLRYKMRKFGIRRPGGGPVVERPPA
jgi:transcriptional regulator with GAF, ATPase, and Fis domain